ncbi:MAG: lactonase family protein [Streptococcaceae bacterium]|jgi:6-phosphogluconolactonase|nr:lactonase family protein [Streptococcaceae bacterium]
MQKIYLSGYTKRDSEGIYTADFDETTGQLENLALWAEANGSTYIARDAAGHIYACAAGQEHTGGISAFSSDGKLLNQVLAPGASLCYVEVDEARNLVYGANYHLGEVRVYKRLPDGSLELTDTIKHPDEHGPKPEQKGALVHFTHLTPDGKLAVCDLGNDSVYLYAISNDGKLTQISRYKSAPGSGDRHLTFNTAGDFCYLACELDSTVEVLAYDGQGFSLKQKISTIPATHTSFNGVAAIRLSQDDHFLYVSNRGHNSIAVFKVLPDKQIELIDITPTHGDIPRDFNFDLTQNFLIVAHQDSDNVSTFKRDTASSKLTLIQSDFVGPEFTCVLPVAN